MTIEEFEDFAKSMGIDSIYQVEYSNKSIDDFEKDFEQKIFYNINALKDFLNEIRHYNIIILSGIFNKNILIALDYQVL